MKYFIILIITILISALNVQAQIGYQISLLNTATGEPRANETVNVTVTLTNSEGSIIYTGNQSATTNDFGVLSLTIGDADTFKEADFSKLPFFIEVSANGVAIGKSQILSVPVAEYAKRTGSLTKEILVGNWVKNYSAHWTQDSHYSNKNSDGEEIKYPYTYTVFCEYKLMYTFNADGSGSMVRTAKAWPVGVRTDDTGSAGMLGGTPQVMNESMNFTYIIIGDDVYAISDVSDEELVNQFAWYYSPSHGPITITDISSNYIKEKLSLLLHYTPSLNILGDCLTKVK